MLHANALHCYIGSCAPDVQRPPRHLLIALWQIRALLPLLLRFHPAALSQIAAPAVNN
jgi:hypothetical protein